MRRSTFARYGQISRDHIAPTLGRVRLKVLTPAHVQGLYRAKLDSGLAPRTVQYIHVTLHKALKQALRWGLVSRNAAEAVNAPRPIKKEISPLSPDQSRALLEAAREDRLRALYVLAVTVGLRQGELLGLRWEDVNLDTATLVVARSLSMSGPGPTFVPPKTAKGRRNVTLTAQAIEALRDHKVAQDREKATLAELWEHHDLVFPNQTGKPMHPWVLVDGSFKKTPDPGGVAYGHPLPRPPTHLRHAAIDQRRPPQDRPGDARPLFDNNHPRHLLPRSPQHAGESGVGHGGHLRGLLDGLRLPRASRRRSVIRRPLEPHDYRDVPVPSARPHILHRS